MSMARPLLDIENIVNTFLQSEKIIPRYERKFRTKTYSYAFVRGYLEQLGFFQEYPQRQVNSLYFDTDDFKFAVDNINGLRYRIKPRLRWYKDLFSNKYSGSKLEYKIKDGFIGYKFASNASLSEAPSLIENRLGIKSSPTIKTSYKRLYLKNVDGVRATIDFDLTTNIFSRSFKTLYHLGYEVVEFKYQTSLDQYFRQILFKRINNHALFRINKSSKYVEGLLACQLEL